MAEFKEAEVLEKEADELITALNLPAGLMDLKARDRAGIPQQDMPSQIPSIRPAI